MPKLVPLASLRAKKIVAAPPTFENLHFTNNMMHSFVFGGDFDDHKDKKKNEERMEINDENMEENEKAENKNDAENMPAVIVGMEEESLDL